MNALHDFRQHQGWIAELNNGTFLMEGKNDWSEVMEMMDQVVTVALIKNGQIFSLPSGCEDYVQAKSAMAVLGASDIKVLSRYVGYKLGDLVIRVRVMEDTNDVSLEIGSA